MNKNYVKIPNQLPKMHHRKEDKIEDNVKNSKWKSNNKFSCF